MKGFSGRFQQFYTKEGRELLKFPSAPALFKREVNLLYERYRAYLTNNFQSTKGLNIRDFRRMLETEGFLLITDKR